MTIILTLIVYLVVIGLLWWLTTLLPLPAPFPLIIQVLFVIAAILLLLGAFGILPGLTVPRVRL